MPWIGGAIIGGASLLGGALGSDAASSAADAQANSAGQSIAEQRRQYDLARSDNAPFRNTGTAANQRLAQLLGLQSNDPNDAISSYYQKYLGRSAGAGETSGYADAVNRGAATLKQTEDYIAGSPEAQALNATGYDSSKYQGPAAPAGSGSLLNKFTSADLNADPVYQSGLQFGLNQGTDAINARATQAGSYDSGATLKALTRFGNDYGSTKANDSFNRFNATNDSIYNKLAGVSGSGQAATNQVTSAGTSMANNVSSDLTGAGNARAAGIVGGANAWGNAASGVSAGYGNYQNSQILQQLLKRNGGGTSSFDPYSIS